MKNLLDELTKDRTLPDGCDQWGIRSVHPDFRSRNDYRWPFPGNKAVAPGPINPDNHDGCPSNSLSDGTPTKGDGICVAKSWRGMASGSIPAITLLLVAYSTSHVLGSSQLEDKHRVSECVVVEVVDGARLVSESGTDANLYGADLYGADLYGANLYGADLSRADLSRTNLSRTNLSGANLSGADLSRANLYGANNLYGADLSRANADAYTTCPTGYKVDNNRIVVTS